MKKIKYFAYKLQLSFVATRAVNIRLQKKIKIFVSNLNPDLIPS